MKIGANVSISGKGMVAAIEETIEYGGTAFMVYTRSNRGGSARAVEQLQVEEAKELARQHGIEWGSGVVHAPYYINLAGEIDARTKGKAVLREEIQRTEQLGLPALVFHPGSHVKQGTEAGIQHIIESLNEILTGNEKTMICLETMAGDGSKVGNSLEEIRAIIEGVEEQKRKVLGVCLDTCHNFSYGYDIVQRFDHFVEEVDRLIGLDRVKVLHLNNSKFPMGAKKDRHANIGAADGHVPKEILRHIAAYFGARGVPVILETPYGQYKDEIDYIKGNDQAVLSEKSLK